MGILRTLLVALLIVQLTVSVIPGQVAECRSLDEGGVDSQNCVTTLTNQGVQQEKENQQQPTTADNSNRSNCPTRDTVIKCAGVHLDRNHNGYLERSELQAAMDSLPWYARG